MPMLLSKPVPPELRFVGIPWAAVLLVVGLAFSFNLSVNNNIKD
jgi:hypothetical protein